MTRILLTAAFAAAAAAGCASTRSASCDNAGGGRQGGDCLTKCYDPCWPERYSHTARLETLQPFQAQAANGVILNNTVWNYHFVTGKDELNNAGKATLNQFVQQRPSPNPRVFLQTSRDGIAFDMNAPEKFADAQRDLNERRAKAVHNYLAAQTASRPVNFEIQVIDPSDPALTARFGVHAIGQLTNQYRGSLGSGGGAGGGVSGSGGGGGGGITGQ
jgi:outer membrane protein OmpA-like peptidoglycan-associated protein